MSASTATIHSVHYATTFSIPNSAAVTVGDLQYCALNILTGDAANIPH